jgi:hypothetical protein
VRTGVGALVTRGMGAGLGPGVGARVVGGELAGTVALCTHNASHERTACAARITQPASRLRRRERVVGARHRRRVVVPHVRCRQAVRRHAHVQRVTDVVRRRREAKLHERASSGVGHTAARAAKQINTARTSVTRTTTARIASPSQPHH